MIAHEADDPAGIAEGEEGEEELGSHLRPGAEDAEKERIHCAGNPGVGGMRHWRMARDQRPSTGVGPALDALKGEA